MKTSGTDRGVVDATAGWDDLRCEMAEREVLVRKNVAAFDRTAAEVIGFLLQKVDILRDTLG